MVSLVNVFLVLIELTVSCFSIDILINDKPTKSRPVCPSDMSVKVPIKLDQGTKQ